MRDAPKHILYIDDDIDILDLVTISLEKVGGISVTTSSCTTQALSLARELMPDIIMLDVMMPQTDGPALLKKIRAFSELAEIPVIFMTARNQPGEMEKYESLGVAGIISKPFNPLTLSDQIRALWAGFERPEQAHAKPFIKDLQDNYLAALSERYAEIAVFVQRLESGGVAARDLEAPRRLAHNLVGSGATYGFSAITTMARVLEQSLESRQDAAALARASRNLLGAIGDALHNNKVA